MPPNYSKVIRKSLEGVKTTFIKEDQGNSEPEVTYLGSYIGESVCEEVVRVLEYGTLPDGRVRMVVARGPGPKEEPSLVLNFAVSGLSWQK